MDDPKLHLVVDDYEIQQYVNLLRVVNKPRKEADPVVVSDKPWEGCRTQAWGSVQQEPDGLIRMWYFSFPSRKPGERDCGGYCYAESRDGIHFDKPDLGVIEFRGSKDNNFWYCMSPDGKNRCDEDLAKAGEGLPAADENGRVIGVLNNMDGLTVVRDDDEPDPDKRYKLIANMQDHRMWTPAYPDRYPDATEEDVANARDNVFGQYLDTSPDGIHWTHRPRKLLPAKYGDYMMVTRDQRNRQWWMNERPWALRGRNAGLRTSKDLINWTDPTEAVFFNDASMGFGGLYEWHAGVTPFNYGNQNLGFLEKWTNAGFGDTCELVCQREGQPWQRVAPGQYILDIGAERTFDRVLIYPTHNAPIRVGDELFIYYTGAGGDQEAGTPIPMAMGVARIGLDRFAGLAHVRGPAGELATKVIQIDKPKLALNVEPLLNCEVRLAVYGTDGVVIEGYEHENSQITVDPDQLYCEARWANKADLSELMGRRAFLHFQIKGAALYSYRFGD